MMLRMLLGLIPFLAMMGDPDPDPDPPAPNGDEDGDKKPTFSTSQQSEVNRIVAREVRKAADKARAERDAELQAEQDEAAAEAQRVADEARGEFDSVKQSLIGERDAAKTVATDLEAQRDELLAIVEADVDSAWEGLPAEVREAYDGEATDVLGRKRHMQRMKGIIDRLQGAAATGGNRLSPKPSGNSFDLDEEVAKAKRRVTF